MTNDQKAAILENEASEIDRYGNSLVPPDGLAALLREAAAMMRERKGISWASEGHGMVLTSAVYRNRIMAIVGRSGQTFFWTVSKVGAQEHEEFGTADSLEAAQAAAVAWVDEQEGE